MFETYIRPTHWWRRSHGILINFWPNWLAQLLCPHDKDIMITVGGETYSVGICPDCYKFIEYTQPFPLGTIVNKGKSKTS
jgi:hypothetical protein